MTIMALKQFCCTSKYMRWHLTQEKKKGYKSPSYPCGIGVRRMVFLWCDQQEHSVPHLDTTQRSDTHVEEDAEQSSHGNHLQNRLHVNRNTWKSQRGSDCYKRKGEKKKKELSCPHWSSRWQHSPTMMATRMPLILCSTTFSISGFGPLDMTVRALAWVTDRTVAALSQGTPKIEEMPPMVTRMSRSQWKPDPFTIFRSGLLTINLRCHGEKACKALPSCHTWGNTQTVIIVLTAPLT